MPRIILAALALVLIATPGVAHAGPPWISIEYPANPHDPATRGALAVVHWYHHGDPQAAPLRARAIGLVNGQRTTVALRVTGTSRAGVFAVRGDIPRGGHWVLEVSRGDAAGHGHATALAALGPGHEVLMVRVPHDRVESGRWLVPRPPSEAEVSEMLRIAAAMGASTAAAGRTHAPAGRRGAPVGLAALPVILLLAAPVAWRRALRNGHRRRHSSTEQP